MVISSLICALLLAPYSDPAGGFALDLPTGWVAAKQAIDDDLSMTDCHPKDDEDGAHIAVFTYKSATEIPADQQDEMNRTAQSTITDLMTGDGRITKRTESQITFDGRKAKKLDLNYTDGEGANWQGFLVSVTGKRFIIGILAYAKAGDSTTLKLVTDHANTLAVESKTPRGGAPSSGLLNKAALSTIAGRIKGNMKREAMDKVIVEGTHPLTYGSVANFVNVIEILFDIQLTEAEFDATRERFIEFYKAGDDKGKEILANQGAALLKTLTTGTEEEKAKDRAEGKAVFTNAFEQGAKQGIGYAVVMWDAITRRSASITKTKTAPKKEEFDNEITQGDLDATMELLYFMWVGAGRDASDVTMEDIIKIRTQIVQELPSMDPQLQLMIANAPKIYAGVRQQWAAANGAQRLAMAQQFSQALDEWGIGAQSGFEQTSGGGSSEASMNAQIAQNTAWNAAKTWGN